MHVKAALGVVFSVGLLQASLSLWGLSLIPGTVDYERAGTWGDWASGLGSVGAVSVALWQTSRQERRLRQEQLAATARELSNVRFWLEEVRSDAGDAVAVLRVHNGTGAPIFRWEITFQKGRILGKVPSSRRGVEVNDGVLVPGANSFVSPSSYAERAGTDLSLIYFGADDRWRIVDEFGRTSETAWSDLQND